MKRDFDQLERMLHEAVPDISVKRDVSWKQLTYLGVGSFVPIVAAPENDHQLLALLDFCRGRGIDYMILGGGANTVGMDDLYDGIVILLRQGEFNRMVAGRSHISCGAGAKLGDVARFAAKLGYGGITRLAGIPGTIGGALRMNAGADGRNIGEFVSELAGIYPDGTIWTMRDIDMEWGYRLSPVPPEVIITAAIFELPQIGVEAATADIEMVMARRAKREPKGRSAGCAFRNISVNDSAGRLIDNCELKDYARGDAVVSNKHANFLINRGEATEKDYVTLMTSVRNNVAEATGLYLRPEVVFADKRSYESVMNSTYIPKVLVLYGGNSREREISIQSGMAVAEALSRAGYLVETEDIKECCYSQKMRKADIIFPVLHGGFGEDGTLQKELEKHCKKFVGCGSVPSKIIMDKIATKRVLDACNISTSPWCVLTPEKRNLPGSMKLPVVVKVPGEGSSFGIKIAKTVEDFEAALDELFASSGELLVEEFIKGVEISVPVVNGKTFPPVEIRPPHEFYDYDAKYIYSGGHTEYFCPAVSLSEDTLDKAKSYALKFYRETGAKQLLRVDFIVGEDNEPYALEGNSLPGFTATSLVPKSAAVFGYTFERLCAELIRAALAD